MSKDYDAGPRRGIAPLPELDLSSNTRSFEERVATVRWYELSHGTGGIRFAQFAPWMIDRLRRGQRVENGQRAYR